MLNEEKFQEATYVSGFKPEIPRQESCEHIYGLQDCGYEGLDIIIDKYDIQKVNVYELFKYCPTCGKRLAD